MARGFVQPTANVSGRASGFLDDTGKQEMGTVAGVGDRQRGALGLDDANLQVGAAGVIGAGQPLGVVGNGQSEPFPSEGFGVAAEPWLAAPNGRRLCRG
ncbi:MAG: hypothetical protein QOD42_3747 [Sphingomonadales bacterium]|nr:hypothetical protein [Sphingomonadales bacterium]